MFYSQFILAKKGPLGTIWIAAHLERKLRKNQVADTDIGVSVDSILFPEMPIALRLSSHLLLGVVRIYSKKVNYLFDDCSEALLKVKQAFRSTAVDLPPEESTAPYHSITLPETFDLDDFELPDNELFQGNYVDHHISSKDQITLQDTMEGVVYSTSKFGLDERFGDGDASGLDLDEELLAEKAATAEYATGTSNSDVDPQASVQANESDKYEDDLTVPEVTPASGIINQHIEDYDEDNEPVEYAQAPCTPGLWEEPNLSKIQLTENHSVTEFAVKENLENAFSKDPHEQHHNQSEPHVAATEQTLMDHLGSTPFTESHLADQVRSMSPIAEVSETVITEPRVQTGNDNHDYGVEHQGNQENACHLTTELESNIELFGKDQDQDFLEPNNSTISIRTPHDDMPYVTLLNHESSGRKLTDSLQPSDFTSMHSFETSGKEDRPSASGDSILVQGEGSHATEALERNFPETHLTEFGPNDFPAPEKFLSIPPGFSGAPKNLVPESTPAEKNTATGDGGEMLSGKKRSFTESSLTAQSLNLNEASGLFTTNTTGESVVNDDDLLSSILVGRKSSVFKMKPTPPTEAPSTKRRRSAPKTNISKRKVLMDDNMVLHGDTIREQLTNTQDIRRLRKKAPCTRSEISMIEKQFWEDELFSEAIFTGLSVKMAYLHNQSYDLSKIKIIASHTDPTVEGGTDPKSNSQNDEKDTQLEVGTENMAVSVEPDVPKENEGEFNLDPEVEPIEFPLVTDYYGSRAQMHSTEPLSPEHETLGKGAEMEIDAKTFSDAGIGVSVESLTHANVIPSDTYDTSAPSQMNASLQADAPGVHSTEKIDLQSADMNISSNKAIESSIAYEISEEKHDQDVEIRDNGICGEEFVSAAAYDAKVNPVWEDVPLEERELPGHHVEDFPVDNRVDDEEFTYSAVGNDTDFLNFDDVDDDEAGDYMPDEGATRVIDNSGWSSRTKAVARYLQIMFDKEGERGRTMLPVNNLLGGKTRKEASRMFFETLVLKTKDYIHVEQADPYENINVFPRAKLLKSDF